MASHSSSGLFIFGVVLAITLVPVILAEAVVEDEITTTEQSNIDVGTTEPTESEPRRMPPRPPQFNCAGAGFPGSIGWTQCFANFNNQMAQFQQQMQQYATSQQSSGVSGVGSSSSIYSNGFKIQANGLILNSNNVNGQVTVDAAFGQADNVDVTKSDKLIKFEIVRDGKVSAWMTVEPPPSVSVEDIKYEIKDQRIHISANGGDANGLFGSSFVSSGAASFWSI